MLCVYYYMFDDMIYHYVIMHADSYLSTAIKFECFGGLNVGFSFVRVLCHFKMLILLITYVFVLILI